MEIIRSLRLRGVVVTKHESARAPSSGRAEPVCGGHQVRMGRRAWPKKKYNRVIMPDFVGFFLTLSRQIFPEQLPDGDRQLECRHQTR